MLKNIFKLIFLLILIPQNSFAVEIWNTKNGRSRLESSNYKNDFYQLVNFFQAQSNPILCSSATALILKNAIFYNQIDSQKDGEISKPNGEIVPFKLYLSQTNLFNDETDKIKSREVIFFKDKALIKKSDGTIIQDYDPGLNLNDFAKILKIHKINSKIFYQNENNEQAIKNFRHIAKKILNDDKNFLVVNFDGKIIGNSTNGHICPAVAYDQNSDSLLILDVALHKNPWYWVDLKDMVKAMNSLDNEQYRGYLIVNR